MKIVVSSLILLSTFGAQASCLEHWKSATEETRQRLAPASRGEESSDGILNEVKDTFLGLGESVTGILEKSTLVPRLRFQERVIRFLELTETPDDSDAFYKEHTRRYGQVGRPAFQRKLAQIFVDHENLCHSQDYLNNRNYVNKAKVPFVLTEKEFHEILKKM